MSTTMFIIYNIIKNMLNYKIIYSYGYADKLYYDKQDDASVKYRKDLEGYYIQSWLNDVI